MDENTSAHLVEDLHVHRLHAHGQVGVDHAVPHRRLAPVHAGVRDEHRVPNAQPDVRVHADQAVVLGQPRLDNLEHQPATGVGRDEGVELGLKRVKANHSNPPPGPGPRGPAGCRWRTCAEAGGSPREVDQQEPKGTNRLFPRPNSPFLGCRRSPADVAQQTLLWRP